ncbi:insulinase family protein [Adhaeribacter aquaticus]|uniref:insulinase family protein n=1 Tax=Adhaeribacter aquaticus TaxID=299567 RepID=UPI0003F51FE9|nr:insulinase family protein [Adhaeribacter aquaticus]
MKNIVSFLLAFLLGMPAVFAQTRQTPPPPGPAPEIKVGEPHTFDLKNGLKVFVVENHKVPTVSLALILDNDPFLQGEKNGYVNITGSMLRTGTKTRTKEQLDEEIDYIGASLETDADGINASSLKKHVVKLFELTADVLLNPQFKQEELDKLKQQMQAGLASAKSDPNSVENMVRNTLLFGKNHPFGEQLTEKTIDNISLTDVQGYYNNYFKPNVGYLAIVGDITEKEAKKLVNKYFASWKKGQVPTHTLPTPAPVEGTRVAIIDRPGSVQTVLSYSNIADLKPGSPVVIPTGVMNTILGGSYSRLMNNLREKHAYTYGAYSQISPSKLISQFGAFTSVRTAVTDSAVAQMVLELYKMRAGQPEAAELQRAQNMVSGDFARSLENPATVALFAINTARYKLPKDYYTNYLKQVASVTPQAVNEAAQKYITPSNAYILAVGDADYIEARLARFDSDKTIEYYDASGNKVARAPLTIPAGLTADKVLENYIAALGGRANLEKIKNITITSRIISPAATLEMSQIQKGTDKFQQVIKQETGEAQRLLVNGAAGRSISGKQIRNLAPVEIQNQKLKMYNAVLNYDKLGVKRNLIGMERIYGKAAYRVELTTAAGLRQVHYFDSETGLKLREIDIEETNYGNATQVTDFGNYQEVHGIKLPHRTVLHVGNQGIATDIQNVQINQSIKDDLFKL